MATKMKYVGPNADEKDPKTITVHDHEVESLEATGLWSKARASTKSTDTKKEND